jgi:hypothetical protein
MCPLCIATGSLLLASAGSAGGLAAVTAKVLRGRRANQRQPEPQLSLTTPGGGPAPDGSGDSVPTKDEAGSVPPIRPRPRKGGVYFA